MIEKIIRARRTVKPAKMNGKIIDDRLIETMIEMADWAPTHGRTEPWRFIVFNHSDTQKFCAMHAELYKQETAEEKFLQSSFDKLFHQADSISHLIIVYMLPGSNPKIPEHEEVAATSAAIQNMLLYATAEGISSFWSTGGNTYKTSMKEMLQIPETSKIMGLLYFGYAEGKEEGVRKLPLSLKVRYGW